MTHPRFLTFRECAEIKSGYLVTVNLQHLYESQRNCSLRNAIFAEENARLCLDGRGARIVFERWLGKPLPLAVGNEILKTRLDLCETRRVLVIGSDKAAIDDVRQKYLVTEFFHDDSLIPKMDEVAAARHAMSLVTRFGTDFSFVAIALGVPKQEMLGKALSIRMPNVPILCIGGSFEMLAGRHRRAPRIAQHLGLEGLWRLLIQPTRERLLRVVRSYWCFLVLLANPHRISALTDPNNEF